MLWPCLYCNSNNNHSSMAQYHLSQLAVLVAGGRRGQQRTAVGPLLLLERDFFSIKLPMSPTYSK
jgi:hypothetical protein